MPPPAAEFCISGLLSPSFLTPSLAACRLDKHEMAMMAIFISWFSATSDDHTGWISSFPDKWVKMNCLD